MKINIEKNEENDHKKLSVDQIVERERRKTNKHLAEKKKKAIKGPVDFKKKKKKKAIKGLVDFNNFIKDEVVEPGQKRSFSLLADNFK